MQSVEWVVAVKPAVAGSGPVLVSDDPEVLRATLAAIYRRYLPDPPAPAHTPRSSRPRTEEGDQ